MTQPPLVSVIMIFLNADRFMQEAIESVLAQTYTRWELILVDDGSTDGSTDLARKYAAQMPQQIRYLQHPAHQNRGMSASRNLGIQSSSGDYLAFLDADDLYLPCKLERQVQLLGEQPGAGMVYGATLYWYSWSGNSQDQRRDRHRTLGVPVDTFIEPPELVRCFLLNQAHTPATCSVLIRREVIEHVGGFEEHFRGMFEDQVFFYKVCLHTPVFVESGCWDRYRQHPESACYVSQNTGAWRRRQPNTAQAAFLRWLEQYLHDQGVVDPGIWAALRQHLRPYRYPRLWRALATFRRR